MSGHSICFRPSGMLLGCSRRIVEVSSIRGNRKVELFTTYKKRWRCCEIRTQKSWRWQWLGNGTEISHNCDFIPLSMCEAPLQHLALMSRRLLIISSISRRRTHPWDQQVEFISQYQEVKTDNNDGKITFVLTHSNKYILCMFPPDYSHGEVQQEKWMLWQKIEGMETLDTNAM